MILVKFYRTKNTWSRRYKTPFDFDNNPENKNIVRIYGKVKLNGNAKDMKIQYWFFL